MQSLAFLWFQLQMAQQYLNEKTFGPAKSPANSANFNTSIGRCNSDKAQYSNTPILQHSVADKRVGAGTWPKRFPKPER
jgi:hypothetical protein